MIDFLRSRLKFEAGSDMNWPWHAGFNEITFWSKQRWQFSDFNFESVDEAIKPLSNGLKASEAIMVILRTDMSSRWARHEYLSQLLPSVFKFQRSAQSWDDLWHKIKQSEKFMTLPENLMIETLEQIFVTFTKSCYDVGLAWIAIFVNAHAREAIDYLLRGEKINKNLIRRIMQYQTESKKFEHRSELADLSDELEELTRTIIQTRDEEELHKRVSIMMIKIFKRVGLGKPEKLIRVSNRVVINKAYTDRLFDVMCNEVRSDNESTFYEILGTLYANDLYTPTIEILVGNLSMPNQYVLSKLINVLRESRKGPGSDYSGSDSDDHPHYDY